MKNNKQPCYFSCTSALFRLTYVCARIDAFILVISILRTSRVSIHASSVSGTTTRACMRACMRAYVRVSMCGARAAKDVCIYSVLIIRIIYILLSIQCFLFLLVATSSRIIINNNITTIIIIRIIHVLQLRRLLAAAFYLSLQSLFSTTVYVAW